LAIIWGICGRIWRSTSTMLKGFIFRTAADMGYNAFVKRLIAVGERRCKPP